MSVLKNGVIVEKNSEGLKIKGYVNDQLIITVTNFNFYRRFEVSQSDSIIGDFDKVKAQIAIINEVMNEVELLKEKYEGRIAIGVVRCDGGWRLSINDCLTDSLEKDREEAVALAQYFKEKYESYGVVVSYSEE